MKNRFDLLIFDWDGTLINTIDWITYCLQTAALRCGCTVPEAQAAKNVIGLSILEATSTLHPEVDEKTHAQLVKTYADEYNSKHLSRADLFEAEKLESGGISIDLKAHKVFQDGEEVHLTLTEFRILTELVRNQGRVLSRDRLREMALESLAVTDRTIDVHMASLRKKLAKYAGSIQTVRGVGYRYAP